MIIAVAAMALGTILASSAPAAVVTLYQSGFEGTDGGWTESGFGDWERGIVPAVDPFPSVGCDTAPRQGPIGAFGGSEAWGTILDGCYTNSGQASVLSQTFDLSSATSASFQWHDWTEVFVSFDMAQVRVNGDVLYDLATTAVLDWTQRSVDLTPYVGGNATIEFRLFATTVVNRTGWYVDDVTLTADIPNTVPEPSSVLLMIGGIGGLFVLRRRKA